MSGGEKLDMAASDVTTAAVIENSVKSVSPTLLEKASLVVKGVAEHLRRLVNPWQLWTFDIDHSLEDTRPLLENGLLSPRRYIEEGFKPDLENLDFVAILAVLRKGVHLCTGKGANAWPIAGYLQTRFEYWETRLDFLDNEILDESFLPDTLKAFEPFFAFSTGNGGTTIDILRLVPLVYKQLPLTAFEGMQRHRDLLADSTLLSRREQIASIIPPRVPYDAAADDFSEEDRVTDQLHRDQFDPPDNLNPILSESDLSREVAPELTSKEQAHRLRLYADIRDIFLVINGEFTKGNFVFDFPRIINDQALNTRWKKETGVKITNLKTFMKAFKILSRDWGINAFPSLAQDTMYVDVVSQGMNKGLSSRLIKNVFQAIHRLSLAKKLGTDPRAIAMPKMSSTALVDNSTPGSNDAALVEKNAGTVVVGHIEVKRYNKRKDGGPVYLEDVYGKGEKKLRNAEMTNLYLRDVIRIVCPQSAEQIIGLVEREYTEAVN